MTPQERKALAEQIASNPLFTELMDAIESAAIESLVYASTENDRVEAQWRVRSARSFRSELDSALNIRERKGAPA
ncbi:MAG: hypothetical protein EP341_05615 [Sphingomonadales bacterium]|nr:MAG: hypothetical protein EP341_05615 [Sphingomonadales bacterium]